MLHNPRKNISNLALSAQAQIFESLKLLMNYLPGILDALSPVNLFISANTSFLYLLLEYLQQTCSLLMRKP